jgi:hypothetical protein
MDINNRITANDSTRALHDGAKDYNVKGAYLPYMDIEDFVNKIDGISYKEGEKAPKGALLTNSDKYIYVNIVDPKITITVTKGVLIPEANMNYKKYIFKSNDIIVGSITINAERVMHVHERGYMSRMSLFQELHATYEII